MTAPEISGVEDGKTYCLTRTITVIDEHLRDVKVNGKRIELDENNQYVLSGRGKQVITATDDYDNVTEITVTISDHHTGGKATCKAKAICDICKMEYGMQISIEKPSITAKSTNGTTIIRWKKVINASGYKVYRAKKKKGKYELLNTTEALSYSDSSIIGGRNYYYKVAAYYKNESTTINGGASDVVLQDRKSTRLNSSHVALSRMPSSA